MSTPPETSPLPSALEGNKPAPLKKVVSWALWDWGTQPFATVITTFVFAVYITGEQFGNKNYVSTMHGWSVAIAGFIVAALAPVLGQNSDRKGRTVRNLMWMTWVVALVSGAMFFVRPEPQYLYLGLGLLVVGTVTAEISGVNNNAILDSISTPKNVGRISGFGWGMGYLGGITVLLVCAFLLIMPLGTFWAADGHGTRWSMVVCMVWMLAFTAPTFLNLKDQPLKAPAPKVGVVKSYQELGRTIKRIWKRDRHTIYFLGASALFRDGLAGVFAFGAVIAAATFKFTTVEVLMFGAAANIVAGVATVAFGLLDDRFGPKNVIQVSLLALIFSGTAIFFLHNAGKTVFWVLGLLLCVFVGPAQSASRSFLARMVPEGRAGEVFGLYATTGRAISFIAPAMYSLFIMLGAWITGLSDQEVRDPATGAIIDAGAQYWGILGIVLVLLAGFLVMIPVKEPHEHATMD